MLAIARHFNRTLTLSVILIAISQLNYGFDNQAFAQTQAMDAFDKQFGVYDPTTDTYAIPTQWLSLMNGVPFVGFAVGLLTGSIISAKYGRRMCMFTMSIYALVSATVVITSKTRGQILAGRTLNYIYIGCELSVVPVFQSEIVPAPVRGFAVSTYQLMISAGGLLINGICRATSVNEDASAYRIPFGLFYIIPTIILSLIWFIPESPRWLMTKDRLEEARSAHHKYRKGTMSDEAIDSEFDYLYEAFLSEPEQGHTSELVKGTNLKRTAIVVGMCFFQQATGQTFSSQYGTIFIKSLGTINAFSMSAGNSAIGLAMLIVCLLTVDRVGRRYILLVGSVVQAAALFAMGGLGLHPSSTSHKAGEVAMLSVFAAGFLYAWGPVTYVVTTELPALRLRDRSQRAAAITNIMTNLVVTLAVPYLLDALESKVGFIFGAISALSGVFVFFCVPECTGRGLEEVDRMFLDGVKVREFRNYPRMNNEWDSVVASKKDDAELQEVRPRGKSHDNDAASGSV